MLNASFKQSVPKNDGTVSSYRAAGNILTAYGFKKRKNPNNGVINLSGIRHKNNKNSIKIDIVKHKTNFLI